MITRDAFIESVRKCIGTPVVHMGRRCGKALDCVGLPWAACKDAGLELSDTDTYDGLPSGENLTTGLSAFCTQVEDPAAAHLWQVYHGKQPRHVVVPVGSNECGQPLVVHALGKRRAVIETVFDGAIAVYWRIEGVA